MNYKLCSLAFETTQNYEDNLQTLIGHIKATSENTVIVAPEVCLSGFDYENFEAVLAFAPYAIEEIKKAVGKRIVIVTIIERKEGEIYNSVKIFHNSEIAYERGKCRLFRLGGEQNYFFEDNDEKIEIVELAGLKLGVLICFELRFKVLWQKLEGADIVAIPSWWGVLRSEHFKILTQSLAIMNQCYVIASDSANEECTNLSGIITPFGVDERNENRACLSIQYNKKEVQTMRRYLDVGIG